MSIMDRPVDVSIAPGSGYADISTSPTRTNLHPGTLWRRMKLAALIKEMTPKSVARQGAAAGYGNGGSEVYWLHDRERGVLGGYRVSAGGIIGSDLSGESGMLRLLPTSPGAITPTASSEQVDHEATKAVDGDEDTDWRSADFTADSWLGLTLGAAGNVDSVRVLWSEHASAGSLAQSRIRGIRIRPSSHQDTTRTAAIICQELVDGMVAHNLNRAYVFVYEMPVGSTGYFWFDTGTADYTPFGSDGADFLEAFSAVASSAGIEVFASLPYPQNYAQGVANSWGLETQRGGVHSQLWLCPNKTGVLAWIDGIIATLVNYEDLTGIDFAEPEWGFSFGNQACWCDSCQAAFAAAHPGETFGKMSPEGVYTTDDPTITVWEQWRADVMTTALCADIADVKDAGLTASVVQFFGINPDGHQLDVKWKLAYSGFDVDGVLDNADAPDEFVWQMTWQEKAAGSKDYVTFCPEWMEYGVRWALANHNGRSATPVIHIGGYPTVGVAGTDFSYGYNHTLTVAEHLAALKAAARGGAINFEGYAYHTFEAYTLWEALDDFWTSDEYNSMMGEVQWNDGGTWRPVGQQAWFRPTAVGSIEHLAHFTRKSEDQLRVLLYPAPNGDREVYIEEVELRYHSIAASNNILGGLDFDNKEEASDDLWLVRYTPAQAYVHRIDETTGLDVGASPWSFDNYNVHAVNDLCILPTGDEPRLLILNQGDRGARASLQHYSTDAPGTLVSTIYPYLNHRKTAYGGITYQPDTVTGTPYIVVVVNTPNIGQRFCWCDLSSLEELHYADSEINWLWGSSLCWAATENADFLFGEYGGHGVFVVRLGSRLANGEASSAAANVLTWTDAQIGITLHPETALGLSQTSQNTLLRVCLYAWDNNSTYLPPNVEVWGVSADGVQTLFGSMTLEASWGSVRLLSLYLERVLPEGQHIILSVGRAIGSQYIGILEVAVNMAITRGDVVEAIARKLKDSGFGDWGAAELQDEANDAICEVVVMGRTNKEDISVTMTAGEGDYSIEPCYEVTLVSLGGESLEHLHDTDPDIAKWTSNPPGVPTSWRQETGAAIRVNPTPNAAALGIIGEIEEEPTAGGSGYVVGDILDVADDGEGGKVQVTGVDDNGAVTTLVLIFKHRESRGTGYIIGTGKATEGGSGTGCTIEITTLAVLEVSGYSGIPRPTSDSDVITAIPEHYILPTVVPLGFAKALENRKDGTQNLQLAQAKRAESLQWVGDMRTALRLKAPS